MKFLFVISSSPFSKDYTTIYNLCRVLSEKGSVTIFLVGNGVYYMIRPEVTHLKDYAKIMYCAHSAHQRGVNNPPDIFESSSTYNLSRILSEFEKVIIFN